MRRTTINLITWHMVIGSAFNIVAVIYIASLHIALVEAVLTLVAINACIIVISRDIALKHEMLCSSKSSHRKPT